MRHLQDRSFSASSTRAASAPSPSLSPSTRLLLVPPPLPPPRAESDMDVDLDLDMDVEMDIQTDESPAAPTPATDAARPERSSWSGVPRIITQPACPIRDRRRSYRHGVSLPVEVTLVGTRHAAQTRMLSFGGAFLESALRPGFGSRVQLRFVVPGVDVTVETAGIVRWSDARGFGVQFDGLRAAAVWALGKFFSRL
jgi:hypothetical protein